MARILRLKCPGCSITLEVEASNQSMLQVNCPSCNKSFAAKVPPLKNPQADFGNLDQFAQPSTWQGSHQPLGPTWTPPPSSPQAPQFYQPLVHEEPFPLRYIFIPLFAILVLGTILPLGYWSYTVLRDAQAKGGFTLLPDSHERLFADYFSKLDIEEHPLFRLNTFSKLPQEEATEIFRGASRDAKWLLLRAVKLGKASRDQKQEFDQELEQRLKNLRAQNDLASQMNADSGGDLLSRISLPDDERMELWSYILGLHMFMSYGMFDLPPPTNEREQIYYEEVDAMRDYFKLLANIGSKQSAKEASQRIEGIADILISLAYRRAAIGNSQPDHVPLEYSRVVRCLDLTRNILTKRVTKEFEAESEFASAVTILNLARSSIHDAADGSPEDYLRNRFELARAPASSKTGSSDSLTSNTTRSLVPMARPDRTSGTSPLSNADSPPGQSPTRSEAITGSSLTPQSQSQSATATLDGNRVSSSAPASAPSMPLSGNSTGSSPDSGPSMERYQGSNSVKVVVIGTSPTLGAKLEKLRTQLNVQDFLTVAKEGRLEMGLRFSGPLTDVTRLVDFGIVTLVNHGERTIEIEAN